MVIDFIAIGLIVLSIVKGLRNGFVLAVFSLLAIIIGLAAALKLSALAADYLGANTNISQRWLPVLAFAIVFLAVVLLVRLGAKAIEGALNLAMMGWLNKLAGIVFYLALYFFVFSVLLFYADQLHIIKPETSQVSVTYPLIYPLAPVVIEGLGNILPFFRDMFAELENFFDHLSRTAH